MTLPVVHLSRLARWGRVLAAHGCLRPIEADVEAPTLVRWGARLLRIGTNAPAVPQAADAFARIGPAAIKLGQALATRPDLVGEAAAADLLRLQDKLPAAPWEAVRGEVERALGAPMSSFFASFDEQAVGAASIAQVHRAVTTDGRTVAVKVLRPGIEAVLADAIDTYAWAAERLEMLGGEFARLRPRAVIANFRAWTQAELDLKREAGAASELAEALKGEPGWGVPAVDWTRTRTKVLTIAWVDGIKLTDQAALEAAGFDRKRLAMTLVRGFLRQAIGQGFFHADLHQGNLFAVPRPAAGRAPARTDVRRHAATPAVIYAIDFGIMGRLDRRARVYLAEILYGLLVGNYRRVADIHFEAGYVPAHHDPGEFATALRAVGEPIRGVAAKDISLANLLDGLFSITRAFEMPVQPHLLLLQKTMVMVEGVALALDPEVNMWAAAEPYLTEWIRDELGPEARLADSIVRNARLARELPHVARRLIKLLPPDGAAPPGIPLPPLETLDPSRRRWAVFALGLGLGALLGVLAMSL